LVNGVTEPLGESKLPAGDYTQMRLIIGASADNGSNLNGNPHPHANYLLMADNSTNELKIPSGPQTGIKLVNGFTINQDQTTELLLDFDAKRSVVKAGKSGLYLLKPTIKVLNVADHTSVQGKVTTTANLVTSPLPGAFVSAQAGEPLQIQAGTVTGYQGGYKLFLMPGSYTLVAAAEGYLPACDTLTLATGDQLMIDFDLAPAAEETTFNLSGTVTVAEAAEDQSVILTLYQDLNCNDSTVATVVIRELNIAAGGDYDISLPEGDYDIVATTEDEIASLSIILDADTVQDFSF
ncbi:MAG: DUF4382 domain-containing protein, partial [Desulfuromusa sp.]|nr:DUF4382 domain-containing protein [Desulfuromusa sp.]